jgi:hypothetical protein
LKLEPGMTNAMMIGQKGDGAVFFRQQIEAMLCAIRVASETIKGIPKT